VKFLQFIYAFDPEICEWLAAPERYKQLPIKEADEQQAQWFIRNWQSTDPAKQPHALWLHYQKVKRSLEVLGNELPAAQVVLQLVAQEVNTFCAQEIESREALLVNGSGTTVFSKKSINQLFAYRGTGKSFLALALAGALANGSQFLCFNATRPCKVLYVDGETPEEQLQERLKELLPPIKEVGDDEPLRAPVGYFRLISLDSQLAHEIPSLATPAGRLSIEQALEEDTDVLVLDSLSTLAWLSTNDEEELIDLIGWLNRLRSKGLCIIFLHHTGKNKLYQRGHSRTEDPLDISIRLLADEEERDHLQFKLEFDKFRGKRTGVRALVVKYQERSWSWQLLIEEKLNILLDYLRNNPGSSSRTAAKDLRDAGQDIGSHTTVAKLMKELEKRGDFTAKKAPVKRKRKVARKVRKSEDVENTQDVQV
jgi:putative DNA primase/helicase